MGVLGFYVGRKDKDGRDVGLVRRFRSNVEGKNRKMLAEGQGFGSIYQGEK